MDLMTAYGVLGVRNGATEAEVRDAHQRLSAQWHPVRFQQDPAHKQQAEHSFMQINVAFNAIASAGFPAPQPPPLYPQGSQPQAYPQQAAYPPPPSAPPYAQPGQQAYPPPSGQQFQPPYPPPSGQQPYPPPPGAYPPPPGAYPPPPGGYAAPHGAYPPPPGYVDPRQAERDKKRSRAIVMMIVGAVLAIIGIAITAGTYNSASSRGGGTYFIAYGPIVVGVINFFKGLFTLVAA